ncbi:CRISPR-associated protein Cas2 [Methanosphaera sp. WGK6]|nr:CRISPR-associated endonuclease Cas2 [Methanosphaera sp. WGK6]OED29512.1 CRISPR-associated protein Cas2 [Methanosphaera sp. WGK6]
MYILIIYDINVHRVHKVYKFLKTYLTWIQNSVFEGEITKSQYKTIIQKLKELIDEDEDSIIIYNIPEKYINREIIGIEKNPINFIL